MVTRRVRAVIPALALGLLAVRPARSEDKPLTAENKRHFLTVAEMLKNMEASPVHYNIRSAKDGEFAADGYAAVLWPELRHRMDRPGVVVSPDGTRKLVSQKVPAGLKAPMDDAERLFEAGHFDKAAPFYRAVIKGAPDNSEVHLYLGDCLAKLDDYAGAHAEYQKAAELNPYDYQTHFFLADSLVALGRKKEAAREYTEALVDKPGYRPLVDKLLHEAKDLGITVHDDPFLPRGLARASKDGIEIVTDRASSAWLAYASCKGFWLGDEAHRVAMGAPAAHSWTSVEELECLAGLAAAYQAARKTEAIPREAALDRLLDAANAGMLPGFIYYEIGPRLDQQFTLPLPESERAGLRKYVRRFILVPWEDDRSGGAGTSR